MKTATKLRLFGGVILLLNLWLIGNYNLQGLPVFLLTFGFAIGYEYLVVRPASKADKASTVALPQSTVQPSKAQSTPAAIGVTSPVAASLRSSPPDNEEELWASAMAEFASSERRVGLWGKVFSQSGGNESAAKAAYLQARFLELQAERLAERAERERLAREREEVERSAKLSEEQRAYASLPKGRCPNCNTVLLLSANECSKCGAVFGGQSSWKVLPVNETLYLPEDRS